MQEPEYRHAMNIFYARVAQFMSQKPEIFDELTYEESFLKDLSMPDEDRRNMVLDWYIFDHKSKCLKKNFLQYFLENTDFDKETKELYAGFNNSVYSVFEIKAIRIGKEMIAYDMLTGNEYNIKDTTLTRHVTKDQLVIMRMIKFKDINILTGRAHAFPLEASQLLRLSMLNIKDAKKPQRLTPLMICEIFNSQEKPERLPIIDKFRLVCKECNLEDSYIDAIVQRTRERVENKGHFTDIQKEFMARVKPHVHFDIKEISKAYMGVWNSFLKGNVEKGPIETSLISAGMTYVQQKVNPRRYKDEKDASAKAEKAFETWLDTRYDELDGKTPKELILEEREKRGNPEKRIKFRIKITTLVPGEDVKRKAIESVNKAIRLLNANKPEEAIELYKEHLAICPKNHVTWQNMGLAYILLCDRENAERCFKKALEIDPDYKVAKNNLRILKGASDADVKRIAEEFRVLVVNKGKNRMLKMEDMYEDTI